MNNKNNTLITCPETSSRVHAYRSVQEDSPSRDRINRAPTHDEVRSEDLNQEDVQSRDLDSWQFHPEVRERKHDYDEDVLVRQLISHDRRDRSPYYSYHQHHVEQDVVLSYERKCKKYVDVMHIFTLLSLEFSIVLLLTSPLPSSPYLPSLLQPSSSPSFPFRSLTLVLFDSWNLASSTFESKVSVHFDKPLKLRCVINQKKGRVRALSLSPYR